MKRQLAVEWLIDEIRKLSHNENHHLGMGDIRISQGMLDELEEQAKSKEEMNIINTAVDIGCSEFHIDIHDAIRYYNETFKQSKQ